MPKLLTGQIRMAYCVGMYSTSLVLTPPNPAYRSFWCGILWNAHTLYSLSCNCSEMTSILLFLASMEFNSNSMAHLLDAHRPL